MSDNVLAKLDVAQHALAECRTAMEAKQIADVAEAARVYLERTHASTETQNRATEIRLLAERQMGEFLKQMPKASGGQPFQSTGSRSAPVGTEPATLAEIGITKKQSSRAQQLADIPREEFAERIAVAKVGGKLSTAKVMEPPAAINRAASHPRQAFNMAAWKRQAESVMSMWLRSVPKSERASAAENLEQMPARILSTLT